jgi:hypothetical protein
MNETFDIVINSKNRLSTDTSSSITVKLKDDIYVKSEDELYLCLNSFHMIKCMYACQSGLNNHFQVIFRLPGEPEAIEVFDRYLPEGNYDYKTLIKEIKTLTNNALFDISFDAKLNKFLYKNLFQPTFSIYIKPISAGIFLGFQNGKEYQISAQGTYSTSFINLSGYNNMIVKLNGDVNVENTISNIYDTEYKYDKILAILNIGDVAPMDSIVYRSEGGCMFKHKVNNIKVSSFQIEIVNEDGNVFPQMSDFILSLKFEKYRHVNKYAKMEELLSEIRFYCLKVVHWLKIPSVASLYDVVGAYYASRRAPF